MESNDLLFRHMEDLAEKATRTGCTASRFLTPAEAQSVAMYFSRRRETTLTFDGGFEGAERVRAVFLDPMWGEYHRDGLFAALQLKYRPQDSLAHRNILGALMSLGIERDTIGDIIEGALSAALICLPELSAHVVQNLTKAGNVGVSVSEIALDALPAKTENLRMKTDTVASLRLDAVLCAAYDLPRGKAAELISAGLVSLNHAVCLESSKGVAEGALVSIRGMGRAKVVEVGGVSRKGRVFVRFGLYGR